MWGQDAVPAAAGKGGVAAVPGSSPSLCPTTPILEDMAGGDSCQRSLSRPHARAARPAAETTPGKGRVGPRGRAGRRASGNRLVSQSCLRAV